jgi:signal peptidase II
MRSCALPVGSISLSRSQKSKTGIEVIGAIAILVLLLDQFSKYEVIKRVYFNGQCMPWCGHKTLIDGWLRIAPVPNFHGAFGLLGSNVFMLIAMAFIVLVIFWMSFREAAEKSAIVRIAFGMILGGAIGNIVDRVHYGYVIDFIDFYRFPDIWRYTFNVADSCITIGVILLLLASVVPRKHLQKDCEGFSSESRSDEGATLKRCDRRADEESGEKTSDIS